MTSHPFPRLTGGFSGDFWKFWVGQAVSTLGSAFTGFALPLLIFKLTGSPLNLALTVAASVLPYVLFGLMMGAWVDRVDRDNSPGLKPRSQGPSGRRGNIGVRAILPCSYSHYAIMSIVTKLNLFTQLQLCLSSISFQSGYTNENVALPHIWGKLFYNVGMRHVFEHEKRNQSEL